MFYLKEHELDDFIRSENSFVLQDRLAQKSDFKRLNIKLVDDELVHIMNPAFKKRVTEFLFWVLMEAGTPRHESKYPYGLKVILKNIRSAYQNDFATIAADVNRRFKFISPKSDIPQPYESLKG